MPSAANPAAQVSARGPLPSVPAGFDVAAALARLGGNHPLFARLARQWQHESAAMVAAARAALQQGDYLGAARAMHTFQGVAATLGSTALAQQAAQSEDLRLRALVNVVQPPALALYFLTSTQQRFEQATLKETIEAYKSSVT